jgi:hypothetical protein
MDAPHADLRRGFDAIALDGVSVASARRDALRGRISGFPFSSVTV